MEELKGNRRTMELRDGERTVGDMDKTRKEKWRVQKGTTRTEWLEDGKKRETPRNKRKKMNWERTGKDTGTRGLFVLDNLGWQLIIRVSFSNVSLALFARFRFLSCF